MVSNSVGSASAETQLTVVIRFKFEAVSIQTDGPIHLMLSGEPGGRYQIEFSEDLASWRPSVVLTNTTGVMQFADLFFPSLKQGYYRAVQVPSQ